MTAQHSLDYIISNAETLSDKTHAAKIMLGRAAKEGHSISIITHRDTDGLMSEKIIANRFAHLTKIGKIKGLYQPPESTTLNEEISRSIDNNPPDLLVITDIRAKGKIFYHVDKLCAKHNFELLWIDHHSFNDPSEIFQRERRASSSFLEVNSFEYTYPASRICYDLAKKDNIVWAAIGILGDRAESNIASKKIVLKAAEKVDIELLCTAKDILEVVGYANEDYTPKLSNAVVTAKTVQDLVEDSNILKEYEPLRDERTSIVGEFLSTANPIGVNCFQYKVVASNSKIKMGTVCVNHVSDKYPNWNLLFYQQLGNKTRCYFRRSDCGTNMRDLVNYCKLNKAGEQIPEITGGGSGAVGALTVTGKEDMDYVLQRHREYCELMDKKL